MKISSLFPNLDADVTVQRWLPEAELLLWKDVLTYIHYF